MAAFGWAETYHRNAPRKSAFFAASALYDACATADHAAPARLLGGHESG
jgi:hypothetical protein